MARDLDANLIDKVEADAGLARLHDTDVPGSIRTLLAEVADNTASSPEHLVIVANPADVHLLEDVTPTGGATAGEGFTRFLGALVYPSSAMTAGAMTVANLLVGVRQFVARPLEVQMSTSDVATGVVRVASRVITGFGTGAVGGYALTQDVVAP